MSTINRDTRGAGKWWFRKGRFYASHLVLVALACTMLLPFTWMVLASLKPLNEVQLLNPIPTNWHPENYTDVLNSKDISFKKYYFNSLFVAGWVTLLCCLTSSMAAFSFARIQWRGRDHVFKLYLGTMMIPGVVTMIPNYTLMVKLHLLDSYTGLIVPAAFTAFGTFLLRQFMLTIPPSLDEAATIDGASYWQIYWDLIMPLARPGLIVLAIFTFMGNYGSFFWPLILIKSEHLRTLPIGMLYFDSVYGKQTNLIMAASVMNIVPLIILFIVMQKHLVRGIQLGAVKG
ncbi:MAG TPA: carbohydrate ABC transporter permease [Candidatus Hydrogenedentes bacterium]|nr:carbohydrate ABC transporter permease [Candidatus Hydrogenedentota bacterium]HPG67971.1 carbohydrate ABC transporter permease [Candidatus Hydrogenedentota bacterium]